MDFITGLVGMFANVELIKQGAEVLVAIEAAILGLVGIFGGADALKRYRQSKFQNSLRLAIETATNLTGNRREQVNYVRSSVPEAFEKLTKGMSPSQAETQLVNMLEAHTNRLAGKLLGKN